MFVRALKRNGKFERVAKVHVELQGSLALTGVGHGTPRASILGLMGHKPETFDPVAGDAQLDRIEAEGVLALGGSRDIAFDTQRDVDLAGHIIPDLHRLAQNPEERKPASCRMLILSPTRELAAPAFRASQHLPPI